MKAIIVLLILSISGTIYSQDYATLKKSDTIYVLFKGKKNEKKLVATQPAHNYNERWYSFNGLEKSLTFYHFKYRSYEDRIANIVSDVKVVDKNFIKKNKARIITPKFIDSYIFCVVVSEILNKSKKIYIIDCTEKKGGKIKLYEAQMIAICTGDG